MKILVSYKSKTGFTKRYAEWISEELEADLTDVKDIKDVSEYDLVIYGGWILGGLINGFNDIKKLDPKDLIIFAVGSTAVKDVDIKKMINENNVGDIPFFYYHGGFNPQKMGFVGRTMVKMVTKEAPTYQDHTNKEAIKDLIKLVKSK